MKSKLLIKCKGFSLVEMAMVLVILALIADSLIMPLTTLLGLKDAADVRQEMVVIKESLLGFAVANGRLPCPDNDADGVEDFGGGQCIGGKYEGTLPYRTLGILKLDSWNNLYGYRVSQSFAETLSLSSSGDIIIKGRGDNPSTQGSQEEKFLTVLINNAPAIIISYGKNGYGARGYAGINSSFPPSQNLDEITNAIVGNTKISRIHTDKKAACSDVSENISFCEFDDIVDWVSPNVLFNRMVAAGKLP